MGHGDMMKLVRSLGNSAMSEPTTSARNQASSGEFYVKPMLKRNKTADPNELQAFCSPLGWAATFNDQSRSLPGFQVLVCHVTQLGAAFCDPTEQLWHSLS